MRLNDGQNSSIVLGIESGFKELKLSVKEMYEEYQEYKCVDSEERLQVAKNYIKNNPDDKILHSKTIPLSNKQYEKALEVVIKLIYVAKKSFRYLCRD